MGISNSRNYSKLGGPSSAPTVITPSGLLGINNNNPLYSIDASGMIQSRESLWGSAKSISDGVQTVDLSDCNMVTCTLTQNTTLTATGGHSGQIVNFIFLEDGTGSRTVTFSTGFDSSGVKSAGANERIGVSFAYNGSIWKEVGGGALPAGTENYILRYNGSNWVATDSISVSETGAWSTNDHTVGTDGRVVDFVYIPETSSMPTASNYNIGDILTVYPYDGITLNTEIATLGNWGAVCIDDDGDIMGAVSPWEIVRENGLYIHDGTWAGAVPGDWTEYTPITGPQIGWEDIAVDDYGDVLIAAAGVSGLVVSWTYGDTWFATVPNGDYSRTQTGWTACAVNNYGDILYAAGNDDSAGPLGSGLTYVSADYGTTWIQMWPKGEGVWDDDTYRGCFATNYSGQDVLVGIYTTQATGGRLYVSNDIGMTFTEIQPAGDVGRRWSCGAISDDAQTIVVGNYGTPLGANARLYMSTDGGSGWSELRPDGDTDLYWSSVSMSNDGSTIIASVYNGKVYKSIDSGVTWDIFINDTKYWTDSDITPDGSKFIICAYQDKVYSYELTNDNSDPGVYINIGDSWLTVASPSGAAGSTYTVSNPISLSGTTIGFKYETDDFQLNGSGELELKSASALPSGLLNNTLRHDGNDWIATDKFTVTSVGNVMASGNVGVSGTINSARSMWGAPQVVSDGVTAINMSNYNMVISTLTQDSTFTATGGHSGQLVSIVMLEDGTGGWTAQFTTGFESLRNVYTAPAGERIGLLFAYDGTIWKELGQPVNGIPWGEEFLWLFKMVDILDYATPMTGLTCAITISQDGSVFGGVTGTPAISEIGYGWYKITIPAIDMRYGQVVLRSTGTGAGQTDRSIYTV